MCIYPSIHQYLSIYNFSILRQDMYYYFISILLSGSSTRTRKASVTANCVYEEQILFYGPAYCSIFIAPSYKILCEVYERSCNFPKEWLPFAHTSSILFHSTLSVETLHWYNSYDKFFLLLLRSWVAHFTFSFTHLFVKVRASWWLFKKY